jgi:CHAT domain-containing protein
MGQYEKAEPFILQNNQIVKQNVEKNFTILSEKEKRSYLKNNIWLLETNNSFLYNLKKPSVAILQNNLNQQLVFKSITLTDTRIVLTSIQQNPDTSIQRLLNNWQTGRGSLAKQYSLPVADRRMDLKQIETKTENLEKELSRRSSEFRNQQNAMRISMQDIQKNLNKDEVAIEFVSFRTYNKKWTDSIMYAAYILNKKDSVPRFVPLCEEKQLGKYFSPTGGAATIKSIYRSDVVDEDEKPSISGDSLYALVWKPLLPYLKGVKKINYSPAGLLYKIAFHALPAGDSQLLMDKYDLNQFISVRQLALQDESKTTDKSISLFGDCQFTMDSTMIVDKIPASEKANTTITASIFRGENAGGWKQLSGTADEIKNIQTLFDKNKISTASFSQSNATEEQFKSLSGNSPSIIHLATHGFFLPDPEKKRQEGFAADERNAFTLADDPLLRSGIVLSGANRVWSGKPPIEGREDGIVTAYEIAQMDLSKTDLVVLSACETALGDIKGNEGVFGLQRAFKLAGVKNMLLSLWKVPDAETAELMKDFYTYYLQGKTAREAFSSAQKDMRKKYKPYFWAAFVLIE